MKDTKVQEKASQLDGADDRRDSWNSGPLSSFHGIIRRGRFCRNGMPEQERIVDGQSGDKTKGNTNEGRCQHEGIGNRKAIGGCVAGLTI